MNKFWKYLGFTALGVIALAYTAFLFILPNVIDLNQYKEEVQKLAKEQAKLDINYENAKIITTPLLGAGVKADNISIKLPDNSLLFSADSIKTRISIPSLFLLTVKVSCLDINKLFVIYLIFAKLILNFSLAINNCSLFLLTFLHVVSKLNASSISGSFIFSNSLYLSK